VNPEFGEIAGQPKPERDNPPVSLKPWNTTAGHQCPGTRHSLA
jgi:hypothetical protein